jgi:uncharacterized membrane protein YkgB
MYQTSLDLERKLARRIPMRLRRILVAVDHAAVGFMERHGIAALRVALAIVFIWFGVLKVVDRSPVEDIVKETIFFLPGDPFFRLLGCLEIAIGVGLLVPVALRLTLLVFWAQMAGTFLTLFVLPDRSFQGGNPLLLGVLGEFVVKNLVLMSAGLVIYASIRRQRDSHRTRTYPGTADLVIAGPSSTESYALGALGAAGAAGAAASTSVAARSPASIAPSR